MSTNLEMSFGAEPSIRIPAARTAVDKQGVLGDGGGWSGMIELYGPRIAHVTSFSLASALYGHFADFVSSAMFMSTSNPHKSEWPLFHESKNTCFLQGSHASYLTEMKYTERNLRNERTISTRHGEEHKVPTVPGP